MTRPPEEPQDADPDLANPRARRSAGPGPPERQDIEARRALPSSGMDEPETVMLHLPWGGPAAGTPFQGPNPLDVPTVVRQPIVPRNDPIGGAPMHGPNPLDVPTVVRQPVVPRDELPPGDVGETEQPSVTEQRAEDQEAGDKKAGGGAKTLLKGTGFQALAQMTPLVLNLAMTPYIIHGVGQDIYGMFLLVMSLQLILAYIDGGVGPSANRYFGLYAGRGDVRSSTRLLCSLVTLVAAANAVLFTIVFLAAPSIVAFFPGSAVDPEGTLLLFRVMIVIVALAQVRGLFSQILFVQHRFGIYSVAELAGFAAYAAGMIWTVETGAGLTGMAFAFVGQQILHTIIALPAAIRLLSWRDAGFVPKSLLIEFFHYSWKIQASNLLTMVNAQGDMVVVGRLASSQMTAFGTGANFASTLRDIPLNAQFPMQAHVVRSVGASGNDEARAEIDKMQRVWVRVVVGWIAVGAPAALFGVNAWLALGTELPGAVAAIMLAAHGAVMLVMVQRQWAEALGYSGVPLRYDLLNTALNLTLTIILVLAFGVLGTVVATLAAAVVAAFYLSLVSRRLPTRLRSPWRTAPWLLAIACSALSLGMTWAAYTFVVGSLVPNGALSLLVVGLAAAPAFLLYMVAALGVNQLKKLTKQIRRAR